MLILNKSHFHGSIHIPNLGEEAINLTQVDVLLSHWEKEAFTILLGVDLYDEMKSYLILKNDKVVVREDAAQKWKDLWHGATCDCGRKKVWGGFLRYNDVLYNGKVHQAEFSPIAYYAYFMWALSNNTNTTGTGEQKPNTKNSTWLNNVRKRTAAWNNFVSEQKALLCFMKCDFGNYCGKELQYKTTMGI